MLASFALLAVTLFLSVGASAQTAEEKAGARAAANSGADAFEAGDFEKAADMFQRAESIIHSPVHELYLARSYAKLGRLVEAREMYLKIIRENDGQRAETAQKELDELEPKVPRVTLSIAGTQDPVDEVTVNDKPFPVVLLGVAQPFDPGEHTVVVTAGNRRLTQSFSVEEGGSATVELDMAGAEVVETAPAQPVVMESSPEPVSAERNGPNGMRIGSYVSMGLGIVGIGVGTAFSLRAGAKARDANDLCDSIDQRQGTSNCAGRTEEEEQEVDDLESSHKSSKVVGIIGFAAGGALLATGVTLFLLSSKPKTEELGSTNKLRVRPALGPTYLGLSGSF